VMTNPPRTSPSPLGILSASSSAPKCTRITMIRSSSPCASGRPRKPRHGPLGSSILHPKMKNDDSPIVGDYIRDQGNKNNAVKKTVSDTTCQTTDHV
jgi:hypothetical protein